MLIILSSNALPERPFHDPTCTTIYDNEEHDKTITMTTACLVAVSNVYDSIA